MPKVDEAKRAKRASFSLEDRESLIEHAKTVSHERTRVEAQRLNEHIASRQELLESIKPEKRTRLTEHLKTLPRTVPVETAPTVRRDVHRRYRASTIK